MLLISICSWGRAGEPKTNYCIVHSILSEYCTNVSVGKGRCLRQIHAKRFISDMFLGRCQNGVIFSSGNVSESILMLQAGILKRPSVSFTQDTKPLSWVHAVAKNLRELFVKVKSWASFIRPLNVFGMQHSILVTYFLHCHFLLLFVLCSPCLSVSHYQWTVNC